jgi:hypothetical protein
MATSDHAIRPDELMAYLDAELPLDRRAAVGAHLQQCASCQAAAAELEGVSDGLREWTVSSTPERLRPPTIPVRRSFVFGLHRRAAVVTFGALSAAAIAFTIFVPAFRRYVDLDRAEVIRQDSAAAVSSSRSRAEADERLAQRIIPRVNLGGGGGGGQPSATAPPPMPTSQEPAQGPKIVRTVTLTIVTKDFDAVRPHMDRVLRDMGGFVGQMELNDALSVERSVRATLRVPADRLEQALRALRGLGQVVDESQSGDDVTEQAIDIDARLANARNTEKRLNDVLLKRTGKVGDVLEVERELARVRGEIEQLDAQRVNLNRRVAYATVTLRVTEQRKATLDIGPLPLSGRLRNAFIDGVRDALDVVANALLWLLRVGPTLLLWLAILWWPYRLILRTRRLRRAPDA